MNGWRGVPNGPPKSLVDIARSMRNQQFDTQSVFARTFERSPAIQTWLGQRNRIDAIEAADLMTKLTPYPDSPEIPLGDFGLDESPDGERVRSIFPNYAFDPLEAQAALAYLLLKNRAAVTVTIGPGNTPLVNGENVVTPPLAFDFSHTNHRAAQGVMWGRLLNIADRLIALLKETPLDENRSFWDRTLLYVASDFGRTRNRSGGQSQFSSGHHLNNGSLLISPMVNGNRILGGVNPNTGMTYGFDPVTGEPKPDREMTEREFFGGLCQIMGIDEAAAPQPFTDMVAMRRA